MSAKEKKSVIPSEQDLLHSLNTPKLQKRREEIQAALREMESPNLSEARLMELFRSGINEIKERVLWHPKCSDAIRALAAKDASPVVRIAAGS